MHPRQITLGEKSERKNYIKQKNYAYQRQIRSGEGYTYQDCFIQEASSHSQLFVDERTEERRARSTNEARDTTSDETDHDSGLHNPLTQHQYQTGVQYSEVARLKIVNRERTE